MKLSHACDETRPGSTYRNQTIGICEEVSLPSQIKHADVGRINITMARFFEGKGESRGVLSWLADLIG